MKTVGTLAKAHGLSRSTLLYYDKIGLLSPSSHIKGEYRLYSAEDEERLEKICAYRNAGILLKQIIHLLDSDEKSEINHILEHRLIQLNAEIQQLHDQQSLVTTLLGRKDLNQQLRDLTKESWIALLRSAGFSEEDMWNWHKRFEKSNPQKHEEFLRQLRIPDTEISSIRNMAKAPHIIQKIKMESSNFMELFFKLFEGLKREGPGSAEHTQKAFRLCSDLPNQPKILDVGCGTGGSTLALAQASKGEITATDVYQPYLDRLVQKSKNLNVKAQIRTQKMDMANLQFPEDHFDLIWCEGAAYIMGVELALEKWKPLLKSGGYLCFTDAVWFTENPEGEVKDFWAEAYPTMRKVPELLEAARSKGYEIVDHFRVDQSCWEAYYEDLQQRIDLLHNEFVQSDDGKSVIESNQQEIDLYQKHPNAVGYEFLILRSKT